MSAGDVNRQMARPSISPSALADLDEIHSYTAEDDLGVADAFVDRILGKFQLLADNPKAGRVWSDFPSQMRIFPFRNYLIFYFEADSGVNIIRVIHGARDTGPIFETDYEN